MSEYINNEYTRQVELHSQSISTQQQVDQLRVTIGDLIQYIGQREKVQEAELASLKEVINMHANNSESRDRAQVSQLNDYASVNLEVANNLKARITKLFIVALASSMFALGMGVAIWVVK